MLKFMMVCFTCCALMACSSQPQLIAGAEAGRQQGQTVGISADGSGTQVYGSMGVSSTVVKGN